MRRTRNASKGSGALRAAIVLVLLLLLPSAVHAQKRVALVIGNASYQYAPALANPKNDATDVAAALSRFGFQVIAGIDLDKVALERKVREFSIALQGAEVGVFFYAGHGLQVFGQNYIVPTDAQLTTSAALELEVMRFEAVQRIMESEDRTNILFFDACRDNPLARNLAQAMGTRSTVIGRGLAHIQAGYGTLISFSTQPGNVALDGAGRNSPFTGALVRHLLSSNEEVMGLMADVRSDVMRETNRRQVPWEHTALTGRFYFKAPQEPKLVAPVRPQQQVNEPSANNKSAALPAEQPAPTVTNQGVALSRDYPTKPVTMVVPFAPGGPADILGRIMGRRMSEILGQPLVLENIPGAGGTMGSKRVADAAPEGYNFVLGTVSTHAQSQTIYKNPPYAATDFTPVALIAEIPMVLITRKDLPVNDLQLFIRYAKANQSKMQYGSAGAGTTSHLGCVLFNSLIGVDIIHVPYRGIGPALVDLAGGKIDYLCDVVSAVKPQIAGGTVKPIAIMTKERSKALPNVPTALEQGTPNLEACCTWYAFFLPRGAPANVVKKLHDATVQAMKTPAVREQLEGLGVVIVPENRGTPEYLGQFVKSEIKKWAAPIKASGVTLD